ncbi:TetR family transcriptional regulator [Bacillus mangrovi]|uniref:TetR family transcriptional regulator n=1 Tax=Metabacillus mangrovi TaxID=1491830 RepID=A0A7X2S4V3_9BACI|nr:TetR/AcrR family transcriptional regulator [Metabacillus mangrovi]MTH53657.1 TetR family transcriptional regulator [Metabacillus mangrovi]
MEASHGKEALILKATLQLISEYGFHGTSMAKVAGRAGVSAGIIYHYFSNKESLIEKLYIREKHHFINLVTAGLDQSLTVRNQVRFLVRKTIEVSVLMKEEMMFMEQFLQSPYNRPEIQSTVNAMQKPLTDVFLRAKKEQIVKPLPDAVIYMLTLGTATKLAQQHAEGAVHADDELIEQVTDACWEAIRL